jgi:hypothetical protein
VRFRHAVWQVGGAEQAGFEHFLGVKGQAVQPADEDGLVVDLDPLLVAAADFQQPPGLDGQAGFLADLADDGVLVPFALAGVAGGEARRSGGQSRWRSSRTWPWSSRTTPVMPQMNLACMSHRNPRLRGRWPRARPPV